MSIYYGHEVQRLETEDESIYTIIKWHPTYSLLAMTSQQTDNSNSVVSICHDQGELIADLIVQRSLPVNDMEWHPEKKLLACGWQSGEITIINVGMSEVYEQVQGHVSPIITIRWSTNGGHLITSDKTGLILVWRLEPRGQLHSTPIHHNQLSYEPTHCVLAGGQSPGKNVRSAGKNIYSQFSSHDSISSFIAVSSGILYYMTGKGQCVESEKVKGQLRHLRYSEEKSILVAITLNLVLVAFTVGTRGVPTRIIEAKLSAQGMITSAVWCPEGTLATASQEMTIRFWDCIDSENYILSTKDHLYYNEDTVVSDISYNHQNDTLAAATNNGQVIIWKQDSPTPTGDGWNHETTFNADGEVASIKWNETKNLLAINLSSVVKILTQHEVFAVHNNGLSAVQLSPNEVYIQCHSTDSFVTVKTDLHISGVAITREHLAVWSDKQVLVYSIVFDKGTSRQTAAFSSDSGHAALYELNVYIIENNKLIARNVQGVVKHRLPVGGDSEDDDDCITSFHVAGCHLILAKKKGAIRVWDLTRREPKLIFEKNLSQIVHHFDKIIQAQINANATRISLVIMKESDEVTIIILNPSKDSIKMLDFTKISKDDIPSVDGIETMAIPASLSLTVQNDQSSLADELEHGNILRCHWDTTDTRLLLVEFEKELRLKRTTSGRRLSKQGPELSLLSVFITDNMDVLLQNTTIIDPSYHRSIGCDAPNVYFLKKKLHSSLQSQGLDSSTESYSSLSPFEQQPLKDFVGLLDCDPATVKAIMSFSYYSAIGNMDEAFKSIKIVKSKSVWENLAKMCIKSRRLDVALVCLGNMGNARAAKAVREAQQRIPEQDARLAVLATQLGMMDEAEDLYRNSGRFDLLNLFYQSSGRWQKAIEIAEVNDRMNLKTSYFNFGKHSEALGEIKPALRSYERSDAPLEIMRMLNDDPNELDEYVLSSKDNNVRHFWAEYLESVEDLEGAMLEYESCGDIHSQVRVLMLLEEIDRAIEVVEETRDKAGAYYLARQLSHSEKLSDIERAIQFFTLAQCYNPALQLAKDNGLDMELMNLALMSTREDKVEVAQFYETSPETQDKAIMLYHKAGELSKALELCFQYRQYEVLHIIAEELSEGCNPDTLRKVAEFFVEQEQFDKAVDLYIRSNKVSDALELCLAHHVLISEELAERMTPEKHDNETPEYSEQRIQLLQHLGDCLVDQGQWHLAAKKFTQSGNRIMAMKALLKSGDTDKITYFTNVSRQKEIYIMAANYLQSLDWRGKPNIMKNIIGFYTKGRSMEPLANFYDTCAQMEIDEHQDYEKAYGALCEAVKCLQKAGSKTQSSLDDRIQFFQDRADLINKFSVTSRLYDSDAEKCVEQCHELLNDPKLDVAIRPADIYTILISHYAHIEHYKKAYEMIEEMKDRIPGVNIEFFISSDFLKIIYNECGLERPAMATEQDNDNNSDEEVIEEFDTEQ